MNSLTAASLAGAAHSMQHPATRPAHTSFVPAIVRMLSISLEQDLQRYLHLPRRIQLRRDRAERARRHARIRTGENRRIERIERFGAQFHSDPLRDREIFEQ